MANDLTAFQSEAWSARMVTKLDQINVCLPLVNRDWEGDLRQNKTVWVRTPGNIAMAPYTRGTTISYQDLTPVKESFTVNDGQYFAFEVDDLDKAQTDINAMDVYMKRAVVAMNNIVETKLITGWRFNTPGAAIVSGTNAGSGCTATATVAGNKVTAIAVGAGGTGYTTVPTVTISGVGQGATAHATIASGAVTAITIDNPGTGYTTAPTVTVSGGAPIVLDSSTSTSTGIYQMFCKARTLLSDNNVPATFGSRWAVINPDTTSLLLQDTSHFVRAGDLGDKIVQSGVIGERTAGEAPGFIGEIAGFMVYETPHVYVDPTDGGKFLQFGDVDALSYAAQVTEIEALRLQTTFANAIRGLLLHDTFVPAECTKRLVALKVA